MLFAGSTVVVALLGMVLLGISFLNGPAIAAALAVLLTMVGSLTLLPALLGAFGRRVKVPAVADGEHESPRWARFSALIERRPRAFAVAAIALLLLVAAPATGLRLGSSDAGSNVASSTTRKAYDLLSQGFGSGFNGPFLVVAEVQGDGGRTQLDRLTTKLRAQPGRGRGHGADVQPGGRHGDADAVPDQQAAGRGDQGACSSGCAPTSCRVDGPVRVSIGGATAATVDMGSVLSAKLPLFVLVVVGLSLLLLAVVFRSLVIPAKAAVMNLLSIGAALGVVTFVFQNGHLGSLIGVDSTGPIEPFIPVFMFAIVFGLSMDYEVFLVTRMHEEWERTKDASFAVRHGLALTGKVITAAAIIMISVFAAFMLGDDRVIKLFGLGLASAVLFDAFVIRLVLVPALMHLFGRASWWMPAGLSRRLPRLSIEGPEPRAAGGLSPRARSAVGGDLRDELGEDGVGVLVVDLAGAGGVVAAAAVLEHQLADVGLRRAVEDRLAGGEDGVLLLEAPDHVDRDVRLGIQRVDHEAVGRVDDLLVAQVEHDEVAVDLRAAADLLDGALAVLVVELDALRDVGDLQDLLDGQPRQSSISCIISW